jgi:hypothetical protein
LGCPEPRLAERKIRLLAKRGRKNANQIWIPEFAERVIVAALHHRTGELSLSCKEASCLPKRRLGHLWVRRSEVFQRIAGWAAFTGLAAVNRALAD